MKHPRPGCAFHNKNSSKDPVVPELEIPIFSSGLFGKTPNQYHIIHSTPDSETSTPRYEPEISRPTSRKISSRAKASMKNNSNQTSRPVRSTLSPRAKKVKEALDNEIAPINLDFPKSHESLKEPPSILYSRVVGTNDPPTSSNFKQLSELLDRLLEIPNLDPDKSYFNLFGEIIRQYSMECNEIGVILNECRQEFQNGKTEIPKISNRYEKLLSEKRKQTQEIVNKTKPLGPDLEEKRKEIGELKNNITSLKNDVQIVVSRYEKIVKELIQAQREVNVMKSNYHKLGKKIEKKNIAMIDLNDQLRTLDQISSKYTTDTLKYGEQLIDLNKQINETKNSINQVDKEINDIKNTISKRDKEIEKITIRFENSRIIPKKDDVGIQVEIIPRRFFNEEDKIKETVPKVQRIKKIGSIFEQIKFEYANVSHHPTGSSISIDSFDDFAVMKNIIAKYEEMFHIDPHDIQFAESGLFNLLSPKDQNFNQFVELFSCRIMEDVMHRSVFNNPIKSKCVQTHIQQKIVFHPDNEISEFKKDHPLLKLTTCNYSKRKPKRFSWLLQQIELLYQIKIIRDSEKITEGKEIQSFVEFIKDFAGEKFGLDYLQDQYLWDIYITGHEHADRSPETDIFCKFVDETYTKEQLGFFLTCRADCIAIGACIPIKTRDFLETYDEYYLSDEQIKNLLPKWFGNHLRKDFYDEILELSTSRPSVTLEVTKKYVMLPELLMYCIQEFADDSIRQLDKLFLSTRILPRLTKEQFNKLCLLLIPNLTTAQINNLQRSTVSKSRNRTQTDIKNFVEMYLKDTLLRRREDTIAQGEFQLCNDVNEIYTDKKVLLSKIMEFFKQQSALSPDDLTLRTLFNDAMRYQSMLDYSIHHGDGQQAFRYFYDYVLAIDILFSTSSQISCIDLESSLKSLECSCHETWLNDVT